MKRKILLIDDSLTVQKVVSLTFDKNKFQVLFAKSRDEAARHIREHNPNLILVSEQLKDMNAPSFPKEVEVWLGRTTQLPVMVLISTQDHSQMRNYAAVLRKPFTPQMLTQLVESLVKSLPNDFMKEATVTNIQDEKLHQTFHAGFSDENQLAQETLAMTHPPERRSSFAPLGESDHWSSAAPGPAASIKPDISFPAETSGNTDSTDLWGSGGSARNQPQPAPSKKGPELMNPNDSFAYKAALETKVETDLQKVDLSNVIERALEKILPPLVEKLVQERLDRLLKENENFLELNP